MKKRHEILAAIAAAAGLTIASSAHAGLSSNVNQPLVETMVTLQTQIGENSDAALSQMIHLAKAGGEKSSDKSESSKGQSSKGQSSKGQSSKDDSSKGGKSKSEKTEKSKPSKSRGYERSGNPKASGGPLNPGKGNKHNPS